MISEGSRDTEDWSNGENSVLQFILNELITEIIYILKNVKIGNQY